MNSEIFEEVLKKKDISNNKIAKLLGLSENEWKEKMSKPGKIEIGEAEKIVDYLNLDKDIAIQIFLSHNSQKCE